MKTKSEIILNTVKENKMSIVELKCSISTEEEAIEILQPIMDSAYEKWVKGNSFGDFLVSLNILERNVVCIGKLNQQVCNGGFFQWIANKYNQRTEFLFHALKTCCFETGEKVSLLVDKALLYSDQNTYDDNISEEYIVKYFYSLDDRFYKLNEKMLCELALYVLMTDGIPK